MFITGCSKAVSVLLFLAAAATAVESLRQEGSSGVKASPKENSQTARADDTPVLVVKPAELRFKVIEQGSLEPSRAQLVKSQVEGRTTIISLRPDGSQVKKDQLICELDSAAFKEKLVNQAITTRSAEAAFQKAKLAREIAEIALAEYVSAILDQERLTLKSTIASAESAIQKAKVRLERTRNVQKRVLEALARKAETATPADMVAELVIEDHVEAAEQSLKRENRALEEAKAKQELLERFTSKKRSAELKVEVEHQRSVELVKLAAWRLEKSKEGILRRQIENCKIFASFFGYIVLANDPERNGAVFSLEVGSSVRRGQRIFNLLDLSAPLRLNTKVHESRVLLIAPGQRARIIFDAIPKQEMTGVVKTVEELPNPSGLFEPKAYTAWVEIDIRSPHLRPGMVAQVEILVPKLDNVLSVPVEALLPFDSKYHLAVKQPNGGFEWREVDIGQSDDKFAVIKNGLKGGDVVALDPLALMSEDEKRQKFGSPSIEN